MESELLVIQKTYELYKQFTLANTTITRTHRYSLGERSLTGTLELLEHLLRAKHAPKSQKATSLLQANTQLEILRFQLRLYLDLKLISETRVFQMQAHIREVGRMLGGWLKSVT
jgi:hypothetical protein